MLFFRSEDEVRAWCEARGGRPNPVATMAQLWAMAVAWYANRLEADARRPRPDEIRSIFARIGLREPFWDPQADAFG
jgi:hypothetical protein